MYKKDGFTFSVIRYRALSRSVAKLLATLFTTVWRTSTSFTLYMPSGQGRGHAETQCSVVGETQTGDLPSVLVPELLRFF